MVVIEPTHRYCKIGTVTFFSLEVDANENNGDVSLRREFDRLVESRSIGVADLRSWGVQNYEKEYKCDPKKILSTFGV